MITIRQIERLWNAQAYERIVATLTQMRPEALAGGLAGLGRPLPAAALTVIRLDELNQAHTPLCGQMIRVLLAGQDADGGWGDPMTTALCLRALMCSNGQGLAIERGLQYLANLQRPDGAWPREPLRRMPSDPQATAFVLYQLMDKPAFTATVRIAHALQYLQASQPALDPLAARLHRSIALRQNDLRTTQPTAGFWS